VWSELIISLIWAGSDAETPYVPINPLASLSVKEDIKIIVANTVRILIVVAMMV
jgi:hypothetical protein